MSNASNRRGELHRRIKRLCVCALLCSLGVAILYLGALLEIFELCVVALAAMLTVPVVIEYKGGYPWSIYLVTALLSVLLLPQKLVGITYLLFASYPILKARIERAPRPLAFAFKQIAFAVMEAAYVAVSYLVLGIEDMPFWYNAGLCILGFVTLNLFDIALTRLITLYLRRYRARVSRLMN